MQPIKVEFRKVFTVRSTYVCLVLAFLFLGFVAMYIKGYQDGPVIVSSKLSSFFLVGSLLPYATILSLFGAIIAVLLITHEYRYSTISYALTSSNSRSKFLASKVIAVFLGVFCYAVVGAILGILFMIMGLHLHSFGLPPQHFALLTYIGKMVFFCEAYALAGLLLGLLLRNQVGTFLVFFIEPSTFEGLMSLLLKHNQEYLPFTALQQVVTVYVGQSAPVWQFSPFKGGLVFALYLVVGWVIAWALFLRRDAI
jgi:ABC-type transport system involved in multi-copper enzyme maturation permease subunit